MYITVAKQNHGLDVEVVDLGQYSAEHSNSCMFLTCAASIIHRHQNSSGEVDLPEVVRSAWGDDEARIKSTTMEELEHEHRSQRAGILGRLADVLRHSACEVLLKDELSYLPFFAPVGRAARYSPGGPSLEDFRNWVQRLRGNEEGDELVMLALSQVCICALQAVQRSGYRVPLMDPLGVAASGFTAYWGNDDKHWVWLRPL
mmetsp:Transcript_169757/g.539178  ORF Transcript_169757/g.539178 Transcript_169757/m.539178 type:complete len:202 (-) Transcript_169757:284-889(-)